MASTLLPFLLYMMLGRSIDLRSYHIGGDLFDQKQYDETKIGSMMNTTYKVLQDSSFPYSYTGFPVDLVLRIKSGYSNPSLDVGLKRLLKETTRKESSVMVISGTVVHTVSRTLKEDAKPLTNWTTRIAKTQTHYAKSFTYGGLMFVVYRFKCSIPGDVTPVRQTLTNILGVNGNIDSNSAKLWEKAVAAISNNEEVRGRVQIEVETYSTFPFKHNVGSFRRLLTALETVREHVGSVGKPISMELEPLHTLNSKYPKVEENHDLDRQLEEFDDMYDDVKNTRNSLQIWVDNTNKVFTEEEEDKIAELAEQLSVCLRFFHKVASEASVYKYIDPELLNKAADLYNQNLTNYFPNYYRLLTKLREDIDMQCEDSFLYKIKGLLQVDESERIEVGEVEGGLEECKAACLVVPECRSIGYVDRMLTLDRDSTKKTTFKLVRMDKYCYVYFRSSSTANVLPPRGASITGVYDRTCF